MITEIVLGSLLTLGAPSKHNNTQQQKATAPSAALTSLVRTLSLGSVTARTPAKAAQDTQQTANTFTKKVQNYYRKTVQLTAFFEQTYTNATFGTSSNSDGRIWIKRPGKMRWDYNDKRRKGVTSVRKSFISDGTTLWAVEHDNKQVFKKTLRDNLLPVAVTFLYGKGNLLRDFNSSLDTSGKYGTKGDIVISLQPKTPSAAYKQLFLVTDKASSFVKESIVIESSGNINHFRFLKADYKKTVKDTWFAFDEEVAIKKRYRIIGAKP